MSDIAKVREMSDKELVDALQQAKQDLWSARFALSTRQLNDTSSIPNTRRQIARILTVQRERGLGLVRPTKSPAPSTGRAARSGRSAKQNTGKGA
ncbi:MAG TPA: 50S ribosomal protein L29 [Candidatus Binatia bacterium]|nr:50S ribosomal protein L29 [Candidatus Binatia bacterium]